MQLASLRVVPFDPKPDFGPVRIPDFKALIAKLQSGLPQVEVPQRRIYQPVSAPTHQTGQIDRTNETDEINQTNQIDEIDLTNQTKQKDQKNQNRYLAMAAEKADEETDFDPIYTYDLNGNRILMIDPTGSTSYTYDELNRLISITNPNGETTTFAYDALGRRTSMTHDNGVVTNYTYDVASQLLSLVHQLGATTINSFVYSYDKVDNRKTKADNNGTANYTYDTLNRLVQATNPLPTNPLESFTYDDVGNRVDSNQNGSSTFNDANQLEQDGNFTYSYDNNGNLTQKTNKSSSAFTLYEYDAENKLIRVVREDGSIVNYEYDGLGRRIEKEVDSVVTQYIYDNEDILLELDGSNNIVARYTHGLGIDEPLILEKGGASFFYHADGLGSITELTDSTGTIAQSYAYSSFGKIESQQDPNFIQPYTFTSRELDSETGLYFYRGRYYDSAGGRFINEDPLNMSLILRLLANTQDVVATGKIDPKDTFKEILSLPSPNLFVYVNNNPILFTDPYGLSPADLINKAFDLVGLICGKLKNITCDRNLNKDLVQGCQLVLLGTGITAAVVGGAVVGTFFLPGAAIAAPTAFVAAEIAAGGTIAAISAAIALN